MDKNESHEIRLTTEEVFLLIHALDEAIPLSVNLEKELLMIRGELTYQLLNIIKHKKHE